MHIDKLKKLNKKINGLLENTEPGEGLNLIERDLIGNYLLQMYEILHYSKNKTEKTDESTYKQTVIVKEQTIPASPTNNDRTSTETKVPDPIPAMVSRNPSTSAPIPKTTTHKEVENSNNEALQLLNDVLETKKSSDDLSDKLRMQPIKDILKSMSINERIFTEKELFGGEKETFHEVIQALNNAANFEEAKAYLAANVVHRFNWDTPAKVKKLRQFLQLVQRRHLKQ